jgi:glycerophosphoryl diester phosphodiesterase
MHYVKITFLLCVLFACTKSEEVKNILVFGHAGMGLEMDNSIYHDNSKEAVSLALNLPTSNGVEVDVRLAADGTLWLYHDELLEAETNGEGCVSDLSEPELSKFTYQTLKHEKLVKLVDALALLREDQILFIDLKEFNSCQNQRVNFHELKDALNTQIGMNSNRVKIICSYEYWLNELTQVYEVLFSTDDVPYGKKILTKYSALEGLVIRNAVINSTDVKWIKEQDRTVYLYDIRSLRGIRKAYAKNPTGIFSDDLRNALEERGYAL